MVAGLLVCKGIAPVFGFGLAVGHTGTGRGSWLSPVLNT
jgi:hypothetical protein